MITGVLSAVSIGALSIRGATVALLFWQLKRSAKAVDGHVAGVQASAEMQILLAASQVALTDKERALNIVTAERDRLLSSLNTVEDQRDALLKDSLNNATPSALAVSVRDALERLRFVSEVPEDPKAETVPDVPGG